MMSERKLGGVKWAVQVLYLEGNGKKEIDGKDNVLEMNRFGDWDHMEG